MDDSNLKSREVYKYIEEYLNQIPVLKVKKSEYLFRADRDDGMIYYILEGLVEIESIASDGKKMIVDVLPEGEFVGFISSLHKAPFHCFGIAKTDMKVLVLKKEIIEKLLETDEFSALFYQKTSKRVYRMYKNVLMRTLFTPNEIMAYYIIRNSVYDVFIYKSIYNIGEWLGISRRGIYNILYHLEEIQVIEREGNNTAYKIIDREYLKRKAKDVINFMEK